MYRWEGSYNSDFEASIRLARAIEMLDIDGVRGAMNELQDTMVLIPQSHENSGYKRTVMAMLIQDFPKNDWNCNDYWNIIRCMVNEYNVNINGPVCVIEGRPDRERNGRTMTVTWEREEPMDSRVEATPLSLAVKLSNDYNWGAFIPHLIEIAGANCNAAPFWYKVTTESMGSQDDSSQRTEMSLLRWALSHCGLSEVLLLLDHDAKLMPSDPSPVGIIERTDISILSSLELLRILVQKGMLKNKDIVRDGGRSMFQYCLMRHPLQTLSYDEQTILNLLLRMGFKVLSPYGKELIQIVETYLSNGQRFYDKGHLLNLHRILLEQQMIEEAHEKEIKDKRLLSASALQMLHGHLPIDLVQNVYQRLGDSFYDLDETQKAMSRAMPWRNFNYPASLPASPAHD